MDRKGYHEGWGACLYVDWDGEGNHVPGPILDRHEARNFGCHTDRVCISLPHSFITTGKQDGHPGGALDHLLVPAWAREEAPEKKIIIFGITEGIRALASIIIPINDVEGCVNLRRTHLAANCSWG
ncbi:hypothetical protein PCH_Pc22g17840 [Penicillium rubens Wisconsin 54-1255]|uniref:Uncharacterized protein n=1 Tax=Penicillium rubens (strain ATCC 28089 / DSM 1075 / NRRL 1951 / Wisconsin 54-1255) TaxID=500485 RepID=B6HTN7_PENRW|nr:hypothetical protein PCH_Pc22g17840 [Penicillium rubens Wisconsin 54-1255]